MLSTGCLLATVLALVPACSRASQSTGSTEPVAEAATVTTSESAPLTPSLGEARVDKVLAARKQLDVAIAPYVADALKSYPQVRARFLAGLPEGQQLLVVFRLPRKSGGYEQVFLRCHHIDNGSIKGLLASEVNVDGFEMGSPLSIQEDDILDWVIVHADGREEGNQVGRFLESWGEREFFGVLFALQRKGEKVQARYLHVLDGTSKGKLNFDPPSVFIEAAIEELKKKPAGDMLEDKEVYTYLLYWPLDPTALNKEPESKK